MTISEQIAKFLSSPAFAVAGASANRAKYGNMVVRCYQQQGNRVAGYDSARFIEAS
jgi:hypothetical protein